MKRNLRYTLVFACLAAAAVAYVVFDTWLVTAIFGAWAIMILTFFGSKQENVRPGAADGIDPKAVKEYRKQHPEASIIEAVNAISS
ncbi:hypothetical protein [Devriesea agamarum]|uniref:hypothetical protein n=1 Tax=Devriesea agamarum TaxID=472569 RepID=UPI00071D886B|nr:hypothetical protein [Devriesea agamarum]